MPKDLWDKLIDSKTYIFFVGVLLLVLGSFGGVSIGSVNLPITDLTGRIGLSIIGIILILVGLYFLIFKGNDPVKNKTTSNASSDIFFKWTSEEFGKMLETAHDIRMISVSNSPLLHENDLKLQQFLSKGGQLRFIYTTPDGHAKKMVAMRAVSPENDEDYLRTQYKMAMMDLKHLTEHAGKGTIQAKQVDYLNAFVLTLVDPQLQQGKAYITINGFGQKYTERPCMVLQKGHVHFDFFVETFDNLWNSEYCTDIEMSEVKAKGNFTND